MGGFPQEQVFITVDAKRTVDINRLNYSHPFVNTSYSLRFWIIVQRVRIAGSVLVGNFLKIHFQGLPSSLYTRKRCSSILFHGIFFLAFEQLCSGSSTPKHPLASLSLSLPLSLSLSLPLRLLTPSLLSCRCSCDEDLLALRCQGWTHVALFLIEYVECQSIKSHQMRAGIRQIDGYQARGGSEVLAGRPIGC
jgi:hypothetical protein